MNHPPQWRKSSYSGDDINDDCVEVAALWRKSSYSGSNINDDCVEVAALAPAIGVRDSKDPDGPHLHFARTTFATLVTRVKSGALDSGRR